MDTDTALLMVDMQKMYLDQERRDRPVARARRARRIVGPGVHHPSYGRH